MINKEQFKFITFFTGKVCVKSSLKIYTYFLIFCLTNQEKLYIKNIPLYVLGYYTKE